mmetsp:Transcript_13319/g.33519  ORF Transcript_13319/g.33519 Transcript_13319/m.33519 type:complete len:115 (+) Transcript_13319:501-845(+)
MARHGLQKIARYALSVVNPMRVRAAGPYDSCVVGRPAGAKWQEIAFKLQDVASIIVIIVTTFVVLNADHPHSQCDGDHHRATLLFPQFRSRHQSTRGLMPLCPTSATLRAVSGM